MTTPLLSIVTVTFHDDDGLRVTIGSLAPLLASAADRVELVVVDGGMSHATPEILSTLPARQVKLVRELDAGIYDGMNKGTRLARGRFVTYLNGGDGYANPPGLDDFLDRLDQEDPVWAVTGALNLNGGEGKPRRIENLPHIWWRHALGLQVHCHQATFFRRELVETLGGYDADLADFAADFDLILRFGALEPPMQDPTLRLLYEGGGRSAARSRDIAMTLHRIRVRRLGLTGAAAGASLAYARFRRLRALWWSSRARRRLRAAGGARWRR